MERNTNTARADGVRDLARWAGVYARGRTLPVAVAMAVFLGAFALLSGLSYATALALRAGNTPVAVAAGAALAAFCAWWVWFSLAGARQILPALAGRLYAAEGYAAPAGSTGRAPGARWVAWGFVACVAAHVALGLAGLVPESLMQPVSALYVVPFLCYLTVAQGSAASPFLWLWPALYAVHAALVLAGVPIAPAGFGVLDMLIPTVGYGLLAALAGHLTSRVALRRMRALAGEMEEGEER